MNSQIIFEIQTPKYDARLTINYELPTQRITYSRVNLRHLNVYTVFDKYLLPGLIIVDGKPE